MTRHWDWIEMAADATGYGGLFDFAGDVLAKLGVGSGHVLLRLGGFSFCVDDAVHQELSRQTDWDWQSQRRLGRSPARQMVGKGDDAITLPGVIYPKYMGGYEQMNRLRAMGDVGVPYLLVDGVGAVLGNYCILSVQETQTEMDAWGLPHKVAFTLSIGAYGDDFEADQLLTEIDVAPLLRGIVG